MVRKTSVSEHVYNVLFPYPCKNVDPSSWQAHIKSNLVTEIRTEVLMFYGDVDTLEAKFPGLDYSYAPHRRRLSRFHHHARLFQAFDYLGLTAYEIFELCNWEGTLFMKRKYEQEHNTVILDTTLDSIPKPEPASTNGDLDSDSTADEEGETTQSKDELELEEATPSNITPGEPHSAIVNAARRAQLGFAAQLSTLSAQDREDLEKALREHAAPQAQGRDDATSRRGYIRRAALAGR